jgi:phage baseplate assembly protein W|tara:strand:- start:1103 stop:1525 length:423 start_codon:yes stop_codon:yes gene_type:complete
MQAFQTVREDLKFQSRKYTDLDLNFRSHPFTKDVLIKKGDNSIKQSVKNLVLTRKGEKPFHPEIGSHIYSYLFDPISIDTTVNIKTTIEDVINTYEPRVLLLSVDVEGNPDENLYDINIVFRLINEPDPITVEFFIERLR